jgi:Uma2 family endonuclease
MTTATLPVTPPADLPEAPDGFELVDGRLVEVKMGAESNWVAGQVGRRLDEHNLANKLGWVWPGETAYRCFGSTHTVRKPDVSFIRRGRLPGERPPPGDIRIVPDLAVEVVSPNDTVYELDEKVEQYLAVGVRLVWVVNPVTRLVIVHRQDSSMAKVREGLHLEGEDVVPGFRCLVRDFLPPPEAPAAEANGAPGGAT